MDRDIERLLERGVTALERLAEDPVIHVESGPPVCPHCERMNPKVSVHDREASGPLGEFILMVRCDHCMTPFYAIPVMYECVKTTADAKKVMAEIVERAGWKDGQG